MMNKKGFTLVELMVVVAIIAILAGIAIPMYNSYVNKTKLQEAVDTLGAIKDEVCVFAAETGVPPPDLTENQILSRLGVQVPESLGPAGRRKWRYRTRDTGC
jgi:prepilin-type N-terminal cleavage/methylation domain-containing protein